MTKRDKTSCFISSLFTSQSVCFLSANTSPAQYKLLTITDTDTDHRPSQSILQIGSAVPSEMKDTAWGGFDPSGDGGFQIIAPMPKVAQVWQIVVYVAWVCDRYVRAATTSASPPV